MAMARLSRWGNNQGIIPPKTICDSMGIIYVDFEPHLGHEPSKYRPALVISASAFNAKSSTMTIICPITSTDNGYPMHSRITFGESFGFACVEQMKALDLNARKCRHVGYTDEGEMDAVLSLVGAVFDIWQQPRSSYPNTRLFFFLAPLRNSLQRRSTVIEKKFPTSGGVIHYWVSEAHGEGLPWLVFLPGLTASHLLFEKQLEHFEGKERCLTWDAPTK